MKICGKRRLTKTLLFVIFVLEILLFLLYIVNRRDKQAIVSDSAKRRYYLDRDSSSRLGTSPRSTLRQDISKSSRLGSTKSIITTRISTTQARTSKPNVNVDRNPTVKGYEEGFKKGNRSEITTTETIEREEINVEIKTRNATGYQRTTIAPRTKLQDDVIRFFQIKNKINPFLHIFVINGSDVCRSNTSVVILVPSSPTREAERAAIRQTWARVVSRRGRASSAWRGHAIGKTLSFAFVFGLQRGHRSRWNELVLNESAKYGDVIQGDFIDSYRNLTTKTLLMLKWFTDFCPQARYLVKVDDDIILNIPLLLKILANREADFSRAILGSVQGYPLVWRAGKWAVSKADYPFGLYPPYIRGPAYVISGDLVGDLFNISEYVPALPSEDAYVTGILTTLLGARIIHHAGFARNFTALTNACDVVNNKIITGPNMTPKLFREAWNVIQNETSCDGI